MARILYGVAGEGFGHSSRSELLGQRLIDAGHEVLFAASQKSYKYLSSIFQSRVRNVHGLFFHYHNGRVRPIQTFFCNLAKYPQGLRVNHRLFSQDVKAFKPDLVISDFEPFSAWWAWRNRVPCVSIDHEHFLTCCRLEKERAYWRERLIAYVVTRGYHTGADAYLIPNFFKVPMKNKSASLTPPVVRGAVLKCQPSNGEHVVMYSTDSSEKQRKRVFDVVGRFENHRFFVYGFNEDFTEGNCTYKKTSTENFLADLASSRGVIATAGFSLISECLHFRKPMLLMPVQDQYEQLINAYYIEKLGCGERTNLFAPDCLEKFLSKLDTYRFDHPDLVCSDNNAYFSVVEKAFSKLGFELGLTKDSDSAQPDEQSPLSSEADEDADLKSQTQTG